MALDPPTVTWPSVSAPEREMLEGFLDGFRAVLLRKSLGLDGDQLDTALAPSTITLGGLIKHMAFVEDWWFSQVLLGDEPAEPWASADWDADPDWEWHTASDDAPDVLHALYETAIARARAAAVSCDSLDTASVRPNRDGEHWSLRWIYVHMIEEYARHCGHADLIRESVDGATGD